MRTRPKEQDYCPEEWVVFALDYPDETIYRVFGAWRGGFTTGDSWRVNSGIESVEVEGDFILFHGHTGSTYRCHKDAPEPGGWRGGVLVKLLGDVAEQGVPTKILPRDTDWLELV